MNQDDSIWKLVIGFCIVTEFEFETLREKYQLINDIKWNDCRDFYRRDQIYFDGHPICFNMKFVSFNNCWICFLEPTSQLVHYQTLKNFAREIKPNVEVCEASGFYNIAGFIKSKKK